MNLIQLLIDERTRVDKAIHALQGTKRIGRPPKSTSAVAPAPVPIALVPTVPKLRKSPKLTAAQRKSMSDRMKRMWKKGKFKKAAAR